MTKLKIKVTKEVLEKSKNCVPSLAIKNCAIAEACKTIWPDCNVSRYYIRPFPQHLLLSEIEIQLPREANRFIQKFDTCPFELRPNLEEISFEVTVPDEIIDEINIDELKPLLENHPTLELSHS